MKNGLLKKFYYLSKNSKSLWHLWLVPCLPSPLAHGDRSSTLDECDQKDSSSLLPITSSQGLKYVPQDRKVIRLFHSPQLCATEGEILCGCGWEVGGSPSATQSPLGVKVLHYAWQTENTGALITLAVACSEGGGFIPGMRSWEDQRLQLSACCADHKAEVSLWESQDYPGSQIWGSGSKSSPGIKIQGGKHGTDNLPRRNDIFVTEYGECIYLIQENQRKIKRALLRPKQTSKTGLKNYLCKGA